MLPTVATENPNECKLLASEQPLFGPGVQAPKMACLCLHTIKRPCALAPDCKEHPLALCASSGIHRSSVKALTPLRCASVALRATCLRGPEPSCSSVRAVLTLALPSEPYVILSHHTAPTSHLTPRPLHKNCAGFATCWVAKPAPDPQAKPHGRPTTLAALLLYCHNRMPLGFERSRFFIVTAWNFEEDCGYLQATWCPST